MFNPFDQDTTFTDNRQRNLHNDNQDSNRNPSQGGALPAFLPHVFPHPEPSTSNTGPFVNHQIYPFSPPATVHKGTAARGRRGRIVSRELQLDASQGTGGVQVGGGWTLVNPDETSIGVDGLSTGGRRRVGRGRGRAVDCITGLPTPPQTKDNRMDFGMMHNQTQRGYPIGLSALPPTPASTVKTKRTIDYRNASGTRLDIPERVDEEPELEQGDSVERDLIHGPAPGSGRTSRMFARQIGVDGSWQVDVQGHHTGSGLAGKKRKTMIVPEGSFVVVGDGEIGQRKDDEREEEMEATDREGTPEDTGKKSGSSVLLSAAPISGVRKGNSFLEMLAAVAADKEHETEGNTPKQRQRSQAEPIVQASSLRKPGVSLFGGDAGRNPFDDDEPVSSRRPTGIKGRRLSFGEPQQFSSDDEEDGLVRRDGGRRLPSPAGMINFKSTKPSLSRSGSSTLEVLKPPAMLGNPFHSPVDLVSSKGQQPEAGPSSPISTLMSGGRGKKMWKRPVTGGEDDPFAEKPGDLERMMERQKQFVRRPERPVMEFTFRGHKTSAPNPLYGLDATPFMAQLSPSHPEFSPAPIPRPKFLLDKFMAQAERAREESDGSSSDDTPSPVMGFLSLTPDGHVARGMSSTSKRDTQSILGKRSRSDQEMEERQGEGSQADRPRSVSEQASSSPNPRTPLRKRVRSSMHPIGNKALHGEGRGSSTTPRSTIRKTGLHRL